MCGRYVVTKAPEKTKNLVKSTKNANDDQNFNAHPGQILPVIKSKVRLEFKIIQKQYLHTLLIKNPQIHQILKHLMRMIY